MSTAYGIVEPEETEMVNVEPVVGGGSSARAADPSRDPIVAKHSLDRRGGGDEEDDDEAAATWYAPFRYRDYRLLWATNVAEFCGGALSELALTVWLFEATQSALALGALGVVSLVVQLPMIPVGGVLADEVRHNGRHLFSRVGARVGTGARGARWRARARVPSHNRAMQPSP